MEFWKNNNLDNLDFENIERIEGDYIGYFRWLNGNLKSKLKYDKKGNLIHFKDSNGYEYWNEYDENGNIIYHKNSDGFEEWNEYDENGNCIYSKKYNGYEEWFKYDENGNIIHYKTSDGFEYNQEFIHDENNVLCCIIKDGEVIFEIIYKEKK